MANTNPLNTQFEIAEPAKTQPAEQFSVSEPPVGQRLDSKVIQERAEKYSFGTGLPETDIARQLSSGGEDYLRQSEVEKESLMLREEQNKLLLDYARQLNRPLTPEELDEVETFTSLKFNLNPNTVLEEAYGKSFANLAMLASRDKEVDNTVMSALPNVVLDGLDAVGRQVARREIAHNFLQELSQRHTELTQGFTTGAVFSELGRVALESFNPFVFNQANRYTETPELNLLSDYAQMFLPGYANVKLGGWHLNLGDSLAEQYREFMLLPPSEFKKRFTETVESLAEDNLPLAMQYAHGFLRYSTNDHVLDQLFGYADWLAVAGTIGRVGRGLERFATATKPLPKPSRLRPPPSGKAESEPSLSETEQIQHIKDFGQKLKDTVKAANAPNASESAATLGDLDAAATLKVHEELTEGFKALDVFNDTVHLRGKLPGIFTPTAIADDMGSLPIGRVNKHKEHAVAHANLMLRILKNNNNITRLTDEQISTAIELSKKQMLKDYEHINDAVLDVSNGGPFRTYTPDEQLVNLYTNELRIGMLPEPPKVPSKTAIARNPNAVDQLLEHLRVERTTHQNAVSTKRDVLKGYNDLIQEYHSNPKGSFLEFINSGIGNGGLFDDLVAAITNKTGKSLTQGQLRRLQREIGLGPTPTGDVFLDRINVMTARRGRILVRDLYDQMKREKKFDGTLGDFRKRVNELRKGRKLRMSSYKNDILKPQDLPPLSPARKVKGLSESRTQVVGDASERELIRADIRKTDKKIFDAEKELKTLKPQLKNLKERLAKEGKKTSTGLESRQKEINYLERRVKELRTRKDELNRELQSASQTTVAQTKPALTPKQGELKQGKRPRREIVNAVKDDFAQRLFDTIASLRVGNPIASSMKFRLPGTKRNITVKTFPELAGRAAAKFRRDTDQALSGGLLTPKNFQGQIDEWRTFVESVRKRVPVRKGSKKLGDFNVKEEIGKRSQSQKGQFDVDESTLEEGNFSSEFRRDVGYGNETFRNRIIDSEIITAKAGKTASVKRAHYIDPPPGFGPKIKPDRPPIPTRAQAYPQANPETDSHLMLALSELQSKIAKTNNDKLYDRISKFLHAVEKRNLSTRTFSQTDDRIMDLGELGSPYGTLPLPSETVERRTLAKKLPKGYRPITAEEFAAKRQAGQAPKKAPTPPKGPEADNDVGFTGLPGTTDAVTARKGATDPAFVGRDYSKKPELPPSQRPLSRKEKAIYASMEREAYEILNRLSAQNKTVYDIKVGKPSAVLFKKREEAAYWGEEVYGLNRNQFKIKQQGSGYYISIPRIVDETPDAVRDLRVTPGNQVDTGIATALLGWGIAPDNYVDSLSKFNRAVATYLPQEMHRLVQDAAEEILRLPQKERDEINQMLIAHRDHVFVDDDAKVRRGRFNTTLGEFEREFYDRFNKMPSEKQVNAYFDYTRYMDLDLALRDFHLVRDMGRLGYEKTSIGFHKPTIDGKKPEREMSKPFATKQIDEIPFQTNNKENWGVFIYNPHTRSGQFHLRSDLTQEIRDHIDDLKNNHGFKILQIGNPLEKPVQRVARTDEIVNFLVVKDFSRVKYDFSNIPKRPGGHVRYQDEIFAKQPRMRDTKSGWIYEGDETFMNFTTVAAAKKYVPRIERARKLLKEGREAELERYLSKNLPFTVDEFKAHFLPRTLDDGTEIPPRFSMDHEFTWTKAGKNTFDMSHFKNRSKNYKGFTNAIRSEYNDFAAWVDKKFLGQRDPDVPALQEFNTQGGKPAFALVAPRLIDPYEMINSSLSNIVRSRYLNDLKIQSAEAFVEQFAPVMKTPIEELRRNPIFYLHNPVWENATDDWAALQAGKHYRQATLHLIGTESTLGRSMNYLYEKMSDGLFEFAGQNKADKFTETFRNAKNPIDLARAGVFHSKLGMLNPVQYLVQSSAVTHAAALKGWDKVLPAYSKAWATRLLALTEDPKMVREMADFLSDRMKSLSTIKADDFVEGYKELKKTGFYNVGGEYANRDDFFDPKVFGSKTGKYLDKSAFFFTEGERIQRLNAWYVAFDEWKAANPDKVMTNAERAKVLESAHFLTNRMARNSNANIQNGSFAVTFQFLSYQWRMAEAILGKSMTRAQKARVLLTYSALYGIPVGASAAFVYPFYDDVRQHALENGVELDDVAIKTLHDGLISTVGYLVTGETYNFNERFGPAGLSTVKELFEEDNGLLEFTLGATGSVVGDFMKSSDAAYNAVMNFVDPTHAPPTTADFVEFFRNISSVNNLYRAYFMMNTKQYFTKNDTLVTEDNTGMDAFMSLFAGVVPSDIDDTFIMFKSVKERKEAEMVARLEAAKYLRRMMHARTDRDWDKVDANLRLAKAAMEAAKIPPNEWGNVLRQAYKGHEDLFERALKQFVETAPPDQMKQRLERATEKLDRLR